MGQSWSNMRKKLEQDYLCDNLKERIQYFVTRYPHISDMRTRIAVRLDGHEILRSGFIQWRRASEGLLNTPENDIEIHNRGGFDSVEFYRAFHTYQNQAIQTSILDADPLVRLFAILDRRIGKRTLQDLLPQVNKQPDWLQPFYMLRLEAEGISHGETH